MFLLVFFFFLGGGIIVTGVLYLDVGEIPYADFGRRVLMTYHCNKKAQCLSICTLQVGRDFSIENFLANGLAQATLSFGRLLPVTSHHFSSSGGT